MGETPNIIQKSTERAEVRYNRWLSKCRRQWLKPVRKSAEEKKWQQELDRSHKRNQAIRAHRMIDEGVDFYLAQRHEPPLAPLNQNVKLQAHVAKGYTVLTFA